MARLMDSPKRRPNRLTRWLLEDRIVEVAGPEAKEGQSEQYSWWQVVCLTGVDYFSTLGYIPGIAALAAGALSPIATLFIVLLTLFGALPMYRRVAEESPRGQGSIAMLEDLLSFWKGKLFVLCLLGFVATGWLVTITLSAADATAHIVENPLVPESLRDEQVGFTLVLLAVLGAVFLKGFKEAIGIAIVVVAAYLIVNLVVVAVGLYEMVTYPQTVTGWQSALFANYGDPLVIVIASLLVFPQLALGLSGFETGVGMMPLVRGDEGDGPERPAGRIRNTRKMLTTAALIMSLYLITTSLVTTVLIPPEEFEEGGEANGRALAYLAHGYLGGRRVRHRLRPEHDHHLVVCGSVCDGGAVEHSTPLSTPLRHGAGLGAGGETAGAGLHPDRLCNHDYLRSRRSRDAGRLARGIEAESVRVRAGDPGVRLRSRGQRDTAPRRPPDLLVLYRHDRPYLPDLTHLPDDRAARGEDRVRRSGTKVHRRSSERGRDQHRRQQTPSR